MKDKTLLIAGGLLCTLVGAAGFAIKAVSMDIAGIVLALNALSILIGILLFAVGIAKRSVTAIPAPVEARPKPAPVERPLTPPADDTAVLDFLSLLQSKGRFVDFVMDDIAKYPDGQVGAAARVVHQGCASVLREYFEIVPVGTEEEGKAITLEKDYNPARYRLVGRVTGQPPFRGTLLHRGWMTKKVSLPKSTAPVGSRGPVIAPAEVELT